MGSFGLYDIDLWHRGKAYPNLELMKIYNYCILNNHFVTMLKPQESIERFTQVIYFKDNPNTLFPPSININGNKKDFYGYGFFKEIKPLNQKYAEVSPIYTPYDLYVHKLSNKNSYDLMKRSSYIRLETNDFTDFKEKSRNIYIADHNFLDLSNAENFCYNYRNYNLNFLHSLKAKDEQTVITFLRYSNLFNRRIFIDFLYSEDFFFENYKDHVTFSFEKRLNETEENYIMRIIKIILIYKESCSHLNLPLYNKKNELIDHIFSWGRNSQQLSYAEYYTSNKKALSLMLTAPSSIRLLLKLSPKKITRSILDLKANL